MPTPPRVLLKSLGCRLNEAELESWAEGFRERGWVMAADGQAADLVVINTCAVTQEATRKSLQLLRRSLRLHPGARLVVSGCVASLDTASLAREAGIDLLVDNRDKDRLVEIAARALGLPDIPASPASHCPPDALFQRGRQRAFIKVQDGCRHTCTFCVTTIARGPERSRPLPEIVEAVQRLDAAGVREVLLTGVHLGGYAGDGADSAGAERGAGLVDLIRALLDQTGIPRLRLGSLEPWDLPAGFWDLFADPRLMPHLHLPMQSGSDRVLRRMARRCKSDEFARLAAAGRARVPGLNLTTDIIVGFPGETEQEWRETRDFIEAMGFGQVHSFPYSRRPGTRAADLPDQVDPRTRRRRLEELQTLAAELRRQTLAAQRGRRCQVLREETPQSARPGELFGYTPNYLPVLVAAQSRPPPIGELFEVRISGLDPDGRSLRGSLQLAS